MRPAAGVRRHGGQQTGRTKITSEERSGAQTLSRHPVEEVRSLQGMGIYLRKFVPGYSSIVAPISGLASGQAVGVKKGTEAPGTVGCGAG